MVNTLVDLERLKGLYVRVSTDVQVDGYSIEAQIDFLKSYLKSQGWDNYKIYTDPGFSGKDLKRPAIQNLIKDCFNKKIDTVLVFKLDRLSRSQKDTLYLIEEVFNKNDVGFISIRERFDTTTPFGKAMIGILSVFAQLERETIIERTRIGLKKRAEDGYWRGGGKVPFAYKYDKDTGTLVIDEEKKKKFDLIKNLRLQGYSYHELSQISGYDESWIQGILRAKTNLGKIPYKGNLYQGRHQAIISDSEYKQLEVIEKLRSKNKKASHYLLSGKIYCGKCGAKYRYQKWGKRIICYCYSQQKSKPHLIKDANCDNKKVDSFKIEKAFLDQLFKIQLQQSMLSDHFNLERFDVISEYQDRIYKLQKKIDNLIILLTEDLAQKEIKKKVKKLIVERDNLLVKLNDSKNSNTTYTSLDSIKSIDEVWDRLNFIEKRTIVELVVDKVILCDDDISIYWNINNI